MITLHIDTEARIDLEEIMENVYLQANPEELISAFCDFPTDEFNEEQLKELFFAILDGISRKTELIQNLVEDILEAYVLYDEDSEKRVVEEFIIFFKKQVTDDRRLIINTLVNLL